MNSHFYKISLSFFFVIAIIGTTMRAFSFFDIPLEYKHLLHAHSHVAFQGWVYTLVILFTTHLFLTTEQIKKGYYSLQFILTIVIVLGILIAFSLQGYALFSIVFSSLFQLLNYWFIFQFFNDVKKHKPTLSLRFIKTGFWLGLLSTLAPWGIGILTAKGYAHTEAYSSVLYFFLHFQYNGWFLFVVFGLLFKWLETNQITYNTKKATLFYQLFTWAIIPAYTLSLLGMSFKDYILIPAIIAALLQIIGLGVLYQLLIPIHKKWLSTQHFLIQLLLKCAFLAFTLKVGLQFLSLLPSLQAYTFSNRFIIMAYMHLNLIGIISFSFIAYLFHLKWLKINWISTCGSLFIVLGFLISELLLVTSGFNLYQSNLILLLFSGLMALGVLFLIMGSFKKANLFNK
ncbi:hypothetical protein UJ101_00333 [Flavobacteriaceae bacterium UJ101]|nr:hypothetical protein UJ101_00333 [Flavobacteriaceae bacterium UJ101]